MVKTETKYTKKTIRDYAIFHFLRKSLSKTILSIIVIIHLLILLYFFECFICIGFHFSLVKVLASGLEINDLIEGFLKDKLGKQTPDLCLDYFVDLFGDGKIDSQKDTIMQTIAEIVKNKDIIRKNIEERCE